MILFRLFFIGLLLMPIAVAAQVKVNVELILNKPEAGGTLRLAMCPNKEAYDTEKGCVLTTSLK